MCSALRVIERLPGVLRHGHGSSPPKKKKTQRKNRKCGGRITRPLVTSASEIGLGATHIVAYTLAQHISYHTITLSYVSQTRGGRITRPRPRVG